MSNALDQHLASRLTSAHVLWVVLEPKSADAVLTDTLDDSFWSWLEKTYPPASSAGAAGAPAPSGVRAGGLRREVEAGTRQRGTVFLVDPRTRLVLWSTYELPRNASPAELDRAATRITNQLKAAFGKK